MYYMDLEIIKDGETGFCFGVRRAIDVVRRSARRYGSIETLGAIVHNQHVLEKLAGIGIRMVESIDEIRGNIVVTCAHGISPVKESELRSRNIEIISTTCPFVHRAQLAARNLSREGFQVVIYGEADHPEVEGVIGWAEGKGIAAVDENMVNECISFPSRLGILSQTTQVPASFIVFVQKLVEHYFGKDSEYRVIDTICHEIRKRQASACDLASSVDLMLIVGGHNSANTRRLYQLCSRVTRSYLVETTDEIDIAWLKDRYRVGVTGGTSTAEEDIDKVISKLKTLTRNIY